nr:DUF2817 domain-containing protein [Pseudopedobacter sp.]
MQLHDKILTTSYSNYRHKKLVDRTFNFNTINDIIQNDFPHLEWVSLGQSFEGRSIRMVKIGSGKTTLMLWSQMHGDEPTATAAIFDLLNFFESDKPMAKHLLNKLNIVFIPVVNPDGLEVFTRRNAQKIDINRDLISLQSPEARILKKAFENIKPDFAFNLHDQSSLHCTPNQIPVGISLLAPASDNKLSVTWNREQAMKIIGGMNHLLQKLIPNQVAKFKDDYESRAFGDHFQKYCPTILVESGFLAHDFEKQEIRKLNFYVLLEAFYSISLKSYQEIDLMNYLMIPFQSQNLLHLKICNCTISVGEKTFQVDLGLNYTESLRKENRVLEKSFELVEIGDLSTMEAYENIDASNLSVRTSFSLNNLADIVITNKEEEIIHQWKSGIRV